MPEHHRTLTGKEKGNGMYGITYIINNTACLIILTVLLHRQHSTLDQSTGSRLFQWLILTIMVYVSVDLITGLQENDILVLSRTMAGLLNVLFFDASYLVSYLVFLYGEYRIESNIFASKKKMVLSSFPLLVMLILTPLSLKHHFFFYIDAGANYVKGPLYAGLMLGAYGYIIAMGLRVLYKGLQKKNYVLHDRITSLSTFVIFPLIAGVLQACFTGISIICLGATVALIQETLSNLDSMITTDSLTHINNRTTVVSYLDRMINEYNQEESHDRHMYLLWMDLDHFKEINDTLGHLEGDRALVQFACVLKRAADRYSSIIARYGGDEFCAIVHVKSAEEKDRFIADIRKYLKDPEIVDPKFNLDVAIGCVEYGGDIRTIPDFLAAADRQMYTIKKMKSETGR